MSVEELEKILGKKLKIRKKKKASPAYPALSIPQNKNKPAHINPALGRLMMYEIGSRFWNIYTDKDEEIIALEPTNNLTGYRVSRYRGNYSFNVLLGQEMPWGKYTMWAEQSDETLIVLKRLDFLHEREAKHGTQ